MISTYRPLLFLLFVVCFLFAPLCAKGPRPKYIGQPSKVSTVDINALGWKGARKQETIIVLDPGHGGDDYGTNSHGTPKFYEKYLNLATAVQVKKFLEERGYRVEMTRTDDTFIPLEDRALFANKLGATLFVSIHYNAGSSKDAEGLEVFFYKDGSNAWRLNQSKNLAQSVVDHILKHTGSKSRGVKPGNYAVIRQTDMPAILIEGGFLTNDAEMAKIKTSAYQKQMAQGITRGIVDYLVKAQLMR